MFSLSLTSLSYFFFVVVFLCIYYRIKKANQWIVLLLASGSFFVVVSGVNSVWWLLLSAVTTYGGARLLTKIENEKCRKAMICGVVVLVLGELFLLKYTKGLPFTAPIAISFYSLSILGYVLDVYWKISDAQKNPFRYLLYVIYFPQMTSGPVTRHRLLNPQFEQGADFSYDRVKNGLIRIVYGMMKKGIIADLSAVVVNRIFGDTITYQGFYVFIGAIFFALQLYADFSGCMDIVIGTSECFGVELPENFDTPFQSTTMSEFWRRWHITLGVWFKEYLLYPLLKSAPFQKLTSSCVKKYGRKKGKKYPTYLGLLVLWFLIGYWHGGGLNYIIGSGLLHWFYIVSGELLEPIIAKIMDKLKVNRKAKGYILMQRLKVFLLVCSGFVFFRGGDTYQAVKMLYRMVLPFEGGIFTGFSFGNLGLPIPNWCLLFLGCIIMWSVSWLKAAGKDARQELSKKPVVLRYGIYLLLCMLAVLGMVRGYGADVSYFIYNKF